MNAEVKKIRADVESTPEMVLGMLNGHSGRMKSLCAIVVWDDDSYQVVHNAMQLKDLTYGLALFQREVLEEL